MVELGPGQVGVGLVVVAADDLHPAGRDELPQLRPVLRVGVEVRLEVVDLGQHEFVVRVLPGVRQVQRDQLERGAHRGQLAMLVGQQQPGLGEVALGVPPDRVVVEVADHPHRPAGLGGPDLGRQLGPLAVTLRDRGDLPRAAGLIGRREVHAHLGIPHSARRREFHPERPWRAHSGPFHADLQWPVKPRLRRGIVTYRDADDLQRALGAPAEQLGPLHRRDPHGPIVTRARPTRPLPAAALCRPLSEDMFRS